MSEQPNQSPHIPDPQAVTKAMSEIAERSQRIVQDFVQRQSSGDGSGFQVMDASTVGRTRSGSCIRR